MSVPDNEEEHLRFPNEALDPRLADAEEQLYSDVSEDEDFVDCPDDFEQNCNKLEQEYFDSLHVENIELNDRYVDTPVLVYRKPMTDFEEAHFHEYNITPDRPCSAYFKTYSFMPAAEIFDPLYKDGFKPKHLRCLQWKPTGEVLTFCTQKICDAFLSKSAFVVKERSYAINDDEWPLTFLTIYECLMNCVMRQSFIVYLRTVTLRGINVVLSKHMVVSIMVNRE